MSSKEKGMEIENKAEELNDDREFVSGMFGQDSLEVPESLSKENMASMLEEADARKAEQGSSDDAAEKKTVSWKNPLGWIAAIAACLLLVVVPVVRSGQNIVPGKDDDYAAGLTAFKTYDEIFSKVDDINKSYEYGKYRTGDMYTEDAVIAENESGSSSKSYSVNIAAPKSAGSKGASGEHSDTYLQVEGVDEADRVKVDGKYLYFIDSSRSKVLIYRADDGKAVKVSAIESEEEESVQDIFLSGDRLVVISDLYNFGGAGVTSARIYDVSDRKHPKKTADYVQSGTPVSQRMVGDILYLVTDQYAYDRVIPCCGDISKTEKLRPEDISCVPYPANTEYTVIGAVDTSSGKELSHVTKAVLGGSQDIYSNGSNLYVAGTTFIKKNAKDSDKEFRIHPYSYGTPATMVIKVKMADGNISIVNSAVVKGTIDDQFSMDEKDGNFRIATTSVNDSGEETNNLFVLDKDLKELGHVSGFAKGESIKAVRYVKDKAYVITYEQTDPLFIIDLKDSKAPKIEGEVKIDGFSTLLIPLSEDRLLGIGYSTKKVETWTETSGMKFALFDISDPSKPSVVTSKAMDYLYSDVQEDHRALVMLGEGEEAKFVIPCLKDAYYSAVDNGEAEEYEKNADDIPRGEVLTMTASDDRIDIISRDEVKDAVERCPVIGDFIYAITDADDVTGIRLTK